MKHENQALRLAQMMQNSIASYPSYELALPLIEVGHAKLKKLSVDDVLLLGADDLLFVLIDNNEICAELTVKVVDENWYLEITNTDKQPIISNESKKYQTIMISFGKLESRKLDVGYKIDITQRSLQDVTLIVEGNRYASGFLTNVNGKLAVMIEKVEK